MKELIMNAETLSQIDAMAEIDRSATISIAEARVQTLMYKHAKQVLASGCLAVGTQIMCQSCSSLQLEPPMCQRMNGTI